MKNDRKELEQFKSEINLCEFLAAQGYAMDRKNPADQFVIMFKSNVKLLVTLKESGYWFYRNDNDSSDKGTLIDYLCNHDSKNIGQIRKTLRPWIGRTSKGIPDNQPFQVMKPTKPPQQVGSITEQWERFPSVNIHPYLTFRGISEVIQRDSRFTGRFKGTGGNHNNVIFAHYNQSGLCGYEVKNKGFTGFSPGGEKGLWFSANSQKAPLLFIMEAAIDCLSHASLYGIYEPGDYSYVSLGGSFGAEQTHLLRSLITKAQQRKQEILIAVDNDDSGDKIAQQIQALTPLEFCQIKPNRKDWNDDLKAIQAAWNN